MENMDCGLTEADHAEWQAWLDIYDLIMEFYESVNDINKLINYYSGSSEYEYRMTDISEEIYLLFKPVLLTLIDANKQIRLKYNIAKQIHSMPNGRPPISK